MKTSMAWNLASVSPQARRLAEKAARQAGLSVDEWLDEAIVGRAAVDISDENPGENRSLASTRLGRAWLDESEEFLESAIARVERRLMRGEERLTRAFETMANALERTRGNIDYETPLSAYRQSIAADQRQSSPILQAEAVLRRLAAEALAAREAHRAGVAPTPWRAAGAHQDREIQGNSTFETKDPESQTGISDKVADAQSNSGYEQPSQTATPPSPALGPSSEDTSGFAVTSEISCREGDQVDLMALREGLAAMNRSLAELAPRNAVVALEGAVRDLTERVASLRQAGEREALLAPLDAMAADLRASLKSQDPQLAVAGLEREISALAAKVDGLAESAISFESFDRIRQQTEEVRNLLAEAAKRSAPLERLEHQISELADRVERFGVNPAPQAESAGMSASLADLGGEVERSAPLSILTKIEHRLECIAAQFEQEISSPPQKEAVSHAFEDLVRRIDGVRQSLDARLQPQIDTGGLEASLRELSAKLETSKSETLAELVCDIGDKLDAAGHKDAESVPGALEPMLAEIIDKLDRLPKPDSIADLRSIERVLQSLDAKLEPEAGRSLGREIAVQVADEVMARLEKGFAFGVDGRQLAEQIAHIHQGLEALSGLREMQDLMRQLSMRLAGPSDPSKDGQDEPSSSAARPSPTWPSSSAVPGIEALEATDLSMSGGTQRPLKSLPPTNQDESAFSPSGEDDVLLEPGAGAPQRIRDSREAAREISSKTNPSVSAHIAAARRAANSALSDAGGQNPPNVARGVERAKSLYGNHKRSVLLAAAFAIVAVAAVRLISEHVPIARKSDLSGQPSKVTLAGGSSGKPTLTAPPAAPQIDRTPTASIASSPETANANPSSGNSGLELSSTVAAVLPASLRDAVAAGSPAAQYELAQRLFEGRGVPQDEQAAALWFERAASSGLAPAQFRLGTLYSKGAGVQRDTAAAKRWYARAAEAGNARAAHNLAVMYAEPVGEKPDYVEAAKWFRKAAELGVRDSEFNLAILYARGLGVDQDLRQSWLWFSLAAAQGDADAVKKRDEVAAKMDPDALAAAANDLTRFKVAKPDPAANEVASPPGGWDGKPRVSPLSLRTPALRPSTPASRA
jgi:localization factor PodJL